MDYEKNGIDESELYIFQQKNESRQNNRQEEVRYRSTRKSKTGRINKKRVALAVTTIATVGTIAVSSLLNFMEDRKNYGFNDNYSTYSSQIEDMLDVDIDENVEDVLNQLQDVRVLLDNYENDDAIVSKGKNFEALVENRGLLESTGLKILHMNLAKKYGGEAKDVDVKFNNDTGEWIATSPAFKAKVVNGDDFNLVNAVSDIQGYDKDSLLKEEDSSDYIKSCNNLTKQAGKVAASMSSKTK